MIPKVTSASSARNKSPSISQIASAASAPDQEPTQALQRKECLPVAPVRGPSKRQNQAETLQTGKHRRIEPLYKQKRLLSSAEDPFHIPEPARNAESICANCRQIDFEDIFNQNKEDPMLWLNWRWRQYDLSHIDPQSGCTLCQFFYNAREPVLNDAAALPRYRLHTFLAKSEFGAWKLQFDDSPCFKVLPDPPPPPGIEDSHGIIMEVSQTQKSFHGHKIQPKLDLAKIKEWLNFCCKNHQALCRQKSNPQVPPDFRVIDCTTRKIIFWETITDRKQYVTLSYVWGRLKQDVALEEDAIPHYVPRTIEESLHLTTELGYRYLWIDRYCITQDDTMSRQRQIQSMDIIYQHSVLTVVAAAGIDPDHGLLGVNAVLRECQPTVKVGDRILVYAPSVKKEIYSSKWNSRGWTYQEGLLSRRKLVFTTTQVYFQCDAMHCIESINGPLEILHTHKNLQMQDDINMFRAFPRGGLGHSPFNLEERINECLERSLTDENDIQDAFKGVFAAFERKFPGKAWGLCGIPVIGHDLPTSDGAPFVLGLSWYAPQQLVGEDLILKRRAKFPSWTWLAWNSRKVHFCRLFLTSVELSGHRAVAHASMEYADGNLLSWSEYKSRILVQKHLALTPVFLHLHGPTFDIHISDCGLMIGDDEDGIIEQIRVRHISPGGQLVRQIRAVYPLEQEVDRLLEVTLLITYLWEDEIYMLALYQPEGASYFERVGVIFLHAFFFYHAVDNLWHTEGLGTKERSDRLTLADSKFQRTI